MSGETPAASLYEGTFLLTCCNTRQGLPVQSINMPFGPVLVCRACSAPYRATVTVTLEEIPRG